MFCNCRPLQGLPVCIRCLPHVPRGKWEGVWALSQTQIEVGSCWVLAGFPDCPDFTSLNGVYVCFIRLRAESPAAPKRITLAQGGRSADLVPLVGTGLLIQPSYKHVLWASGGCFEPSWCLERNLWLQAKLCTSGLAVGRRPRVLHTGKQGPKTVPP